MIEPTMNATPPRKNSRSHTSTAATTFSANPVSEIALGVRRDSIRRLRTSSRRSPDPIGARAAERLARAERLAALREKSEAWWEEDVTFFDVQRSRAWVMTRRMTHTSHHRGQLMAMLRMLGRDVHSNYGPTADTGGLMQNHAPTIYAYESLEELLAGESAGGRKAALPGSRGRR